VSRRRGLAIAAALLVAIAIRIWVGAPLMVHTEGMSPAIVPGDWVWVRFRAPHVGEVARVRMDVGEAPQLARMVAGPGQMVEVSEGVLYVDGMPAALGRTRRSESCRGQPLRQAAERWRGRRVWVVQGAPVAPTRVPAGHAFLLGDHRPAAGDSQRWGTVSMDQLEGVATTLVWPAGRCRPSRWSDLGKRID